MSPRLSPQRYSGSEAAKKLRREKKKANPAQTEEVKPPSMRVAVSIVAAAVVIALWISGVF